MRQTGTYIFPSQVFVDTALRQRCLSASSMAMMLDLASDTLSIDFRAVLRDGTEEEANDPRFRRPLINLLGLVGYQEELRRRDFQPVCVTGISLGVLTAAGAVGWVSVEDMVRMSNLMATVELDHFEGTDYRSVFFYNCGYETVLDALRSRGLGDLLHMSVIVSSNQFIAACRESDMAAIRPTLMKLGGLYKVIPYSMPGHCDLMGDVEKVFAAEWSPRDPTGNLSIPLVIDAGRATTSATEVCRLAASQYTTILDWRGILDYLSGMALDSCVVLEPSDFVVKSMNLDPLCTLSPEVGGVIARGE